MAGPARYDSIGKGYNDLRVPDVRIAAYLHAELDGAKSVINVGAGTGAYEPAASELVAVDPSALMMGEYRGSGQRVRAVAAGLPFANCRFDAAMAILTMHHWPDWQAGLAELCRVSRRVVILTHEPSLAEFWLLDYLPRIREIDMEIFSTGDEIATFARSLGWATRAFPLPVPHDCTDGFLGAYWRRPAAYLEPRVRQAISTFHTLAPAETSAAMKRLGSDLASGQWQAQYAGLVELDALDVGYRVVTLTPGVVNGEPV